MYGQREDIMLCYPLEEKRLIKWSPPYIIQPKLDGDRCRCVIDQDGEVELISSEGNPRNQSVPHIAQEVKELIRLNILVPPFETDGELYIHEGGYHEMIHGIVSRTKNLHPDHLKAQYYLFDVITDHPQSIRSSYLNNLIPEIDQVESIKIVPSKTVWTIEEVTEAINEYIVQGYEGIIVRRPSGMYIRKRSTNMMKFKPRKEDSYIILGYKEEISIHEEPKGTLGALILSSADNDTFKVGTGPLLTKENRKELWKVREQLIGKTATIKYQRMSAGRKVPVFPVLFSIE